MTAAEKSPVRAAMNNPQDEATPYEEEKDKLEPSSDEKDDGIEYDFDFREVVA